MFKEMQMQITKLTYTFFAHLLLHAHLAHILRLTFFGTLTNTMTPLQNKPFVTIIQT